MGYQRKYVYEIVRQWQEDYEVETGIASCYDKAITIANEWVNEIINDGYSNEVDGEDLFFGSDNEMYKCYIDGDNDFSVRIWIEQKEIL